MWFIFKANSVESQSLFQTGWFVESLMTQTLIVHIIRTAKIPFLQSRPSLVMALVTLGVMAIGIMIPFTPIGSALGMVPLPGLYFTWLAVILVGYCTFTQVIKSWFVARYGYN
jgi:Mg2+-importing ATPase